MPSFRAQGLPNASGAQPVVLGLCGNPSEIRFNEILIYGGVYWNEKQEWIPENVQMVEGNWGKDWVKSGPRVVIIRKNSGKR